MATYTIERRKLARSPLATGPGFAWTWLYNVKVGGALVLQGETRLASAMKYARDHARRNGGEAVIEKAWEPRSFTPCAYPSRGFTLVELLVCIVVIVILVSLTLTALAGARAQSRDTKCRSNLRQIHVGVLAFATDQRAVPFYVGPGDVLDLPAAVYDCPADHPDAEGYPGSYEWFTYDLRTLDAIPSTMVLKEQRPNHPHRNTIAWDGRLAVLP